jgi:hypothetical protein
MGWIVSLSVRQTPSPFGMLWGQSNTGGRFLIFGYLNIALDLNIAPDTHTQSHPRVGILTLLRYVARCC